MSWPMVKLGDVVTVNPRAPKEIDSTQIVSFVGMASVSEDGQLLSEEPRVLEETKKGFTYFAKSDVLLAKITPCFENGKCLRANQIANLVGFGSTEFHVLRPDESRLDATYLFYMIWSDQFRVLGAASMSGAAGQKRVGSDFLKNFEIPLPPLTEQKRIAAILDKADAIRRKRQQAIQLADDFLRAVFLEMFGDPVTNPKGWNVKLLKNLCVIKGGGTPSKSDSRFWGGHIPWVSPKDMKSLYINTSKDKITTEAIKASSTNLIETNSILMVVRSGVLKHTVPLALTTGPVTINQDMKAMSCLKELNPYFLLFCLKESSTFLLGTVRGTTADNLSSDVVNNLLVPVPPLRLQDKFAVIAQRHQKIKITKENSYDLSLTSFNSLSNRAFSGQL